MAEQVALRRSLAGLNPQDFIDAGSIPKRFRGIVRLARYAPRPLKKDGLKHGFFALLRVEDLETEIMHDIWLRAGWLPRQFEDGRIAGTVPSNDGPDVDDDDRKPTASIAFFMGLGDGTKQVPEGTDLVEEYGGVYAMGDLMTKSEPWYAFCVALAECEYPFSDQSIAGLEGWTLTLESTKIGTYTSDKGERDLKVHLVVEAEPPAKKKTSKASGSSGTSAATETVATSGKKSKPAPKPKPEPEPDEEEEEEEQEENSPVEVLHDVIVGLLKKKPDREMQEGSVMIEAMKDASFRELSNKDRKLAMAAYNDRSLFEDSDVLILDEEADTVSLKTSKKGSIGRSA